MLQFTENPAPPFTQNPQFSNLNMMNNNNNNNNQVQRNRSLLGFPATKFFGSFRDANCMEQLLVHCANAIESNDATLAQQILWVLNNIAPPDGDSNQRLACAFLRALIARAANNGTCKMLAAAMADAAQSSNLALEAAHKFSVIELASFVDLTPWHRFGYTAANASILEAVEGYSVVHIVDMSLTHCMQIPTLIEALANRPEGPPFIKLTVASAPEGVPPMLDLSYNELGNKLMSFARSRNILLQFKVINSSYVDGFSYFLDQLRVQNLVYPESGEALVVNCQMMLHCIPDETIPANPNPYSFEPNSASSLRAMFLKKLRSLDPIIVLVVDEDADLTSNNLVCRLRAAFNYLWIPYDTVDTFLPRGSMQRQWYEASICWKIENVIAQEGLHRVERLEPRSRWMQRMINAGFRGISFSDDGVSEVKTMLDEHAAGWGMKKEDDDLVLTWKGHNVVFASAWVSA